MRRFFAPLLALGLVIGVAACSNSDGASDGVDKSTTTASPDGDGTTTTASGGHHHSGGAVIEGTKVLQFWVRGDKLATGANGVPEGSSAIGKGAIELLLAGPSQPDSLSGMTTLIPDGTKLLGLNIDDGTATIDLSKEFASGGGTTSMQLRVAQVVFTLTQFPTVERVAFRIDGTEPEGIGGEGLPTTYDGRDDFEDVTPAILPESPTPYQNVTSPLTIRGTANTFEAVVHWSVRTTEGSLLEEGTTTATAGSGTRGTFEIEAELPAYPGNVVITLWEPSAASGTERTNIYEVLVNLN